ncbi:MAG: hypothetical protein ACXQS4_02015, partial [Methermicoccaceae archaeon]
QRYDEAMAICPIIQCPVTPLVIVYARFLLEEGKERKGLKMLKRAEEWVKALGCFEREFGDDKK